MAADPKNDAAAGVFQCEAFAFAMVHAFIERVTADAEKSPDALTVDRLRAMAKQFSEEDGDRFRSMFRERVADYLEQREREIWDQARKRPFDRVLVKRFSRLFAAEGTLGTSQGAVSRRLLPGFFKAMEMMAGPELFEQCQRACKGIVKNIRDEKGGDGGDLFEDLYVNPDANGLVDDMLAAVATHFADFDARIRWLLQLVNGHLAPSEDYEFEGGAVHDWKLEKPALERLLGSLFSGIRERMATGDGQQQIRERYGQKGFDVLEAVVKNLAGTD